MDNLIAILDKLKIVQNNLRMDSSIVPHIVLVGAQGCGKSTIVESIVGINFLPRSEEGKTRCPLIVQLKNQNQSSFANFEHLPKVTFTDLDEVQKEIANVTNKYAGKNHGISTKPILLTICGASFPEITLVDLPGFTEVAIGEQPVDISVKLKRLALQYMKVSDSIILAVAPATTDITTNECLMLARMLDTSGTRTLVVVSKLDMAGPGVDLTPTLTGTESTGFRRIVGVVGRGFKAGKEKKKPSDVLKQERKFLHAKYPKIYRAHGTPRLLEELEGLLKGYLLEKIPEYRRTVSNAISNAKEDVEALSKHVADPGDVIMQQLTLFANAFLAQLTGNTSEIETKCLVGGARISFIFREVFNVDLDELDPLTGLTRPQIMTALRNTSGTRPDVLFIPEACFENLARRQVLMLVSLCRGCVEMVYQELLCLAKECANKVLPERYPKLNRTIVTITSDLIEQGRIESSELVEDLINMELSYINTLDQSFQADLDASTVQWLVTRGLHTPPESKESAQPYQNQLRKSQSEGSWLASFLIRRLDEGERLGIAPSAPTVALVTGTDKEHADCQLVEKMITSYVNAVKRSLKASIPKAIMYRMVNFVHARLYHNLMHHIRTTPEPDLLREPEDVLLKRDELKNSLKQLQLTRDLVEDVSEMVKSR